LKNNSLLGIAPPGGPCDVGFGASTYGSDCYKRLIQDVDFDLILKEMRRLYGGVVVS
jgi:hypothetical protein